MRAETWEQSNRALLGTAKDDGIETGRKLRIDSTVTETHILEPSDSQFTVTTRCACSRGC